MPTVQYQGNFEPWSAVPVSLTDVATDFDYANQIDTSDSDPDNFEYFFEAYAPVPVVLSDVANEFAEQLVNDDDDPVAESSFEPGNDTLTAIVFSAVIDDPDLDTPPDVNDDDDVPLDWSVDPVGDALADTAFSVLLDAPDDDSGIVLAEDDFIVEQPSFELPNDVLTAEIFSQVVDDPDFDSANVNDEDDAIAESSFEPWIDYGAGALISDSTGDYDGAQPPNDDDDPAIEVPLEFWAAIPVDTLAESGYICDSDIWSDPLDDPIAEWNFEPWVDYGAVVILDAPAFDASQFFNDDDAIGESFDGIDAGIDAPAFDSVGLSDEDELQLFESSMESWADANIDAPAYETTVAIDEDGELVIESWAEPWTAIPVNLRDVALDFDAAQLPNDPDEPTIEPEHAFEPWVDYGVFIFNDGRIDYDAHQQPNADDDPVFEFEFSPFIGISTLPDSVVSSTRNVGNERTDCLKFDRRATLLLDNDRETAEAFSDRATLERKNDRTAEDA